MHVEHGQVDVGYVSLPYSLFPAVGKGAVEPSATGCGLDVDVGDK